MLGRNYRIANDEIFVKKIDGSDKNDDKESTKEDNLFKHYPLRKRTLFNSSGLLVLQFEYSS